MGVIRRKFGRCCCWLDPIGLTEEHMGGFFVFFWKIGVLSWEYSGWGVKCGVLENWAVQRRRLSGDWQGGEERARQGARREGGGGGMTRRRGKISERLSEVGSDVMSSRCLGFHVSHVCFWQPEILRSNQLFSRWQQCFLFVAKAWNRKNIFCRIGWRWLFCMSTIQPMLVGFSFPDHSRGCQKRQVAISIMWAMLTSNERCDGDAERHLAISYCLPWQLAQLHTIPVWILSNYDMRISL